MVSNENDVASTMIQLFALLWPMRLYVTISRLHEGPHFIDVLITVSNPYMRVLESRHEFYETTCRSSIDPSQVLKFAVIIQGESSFLPLNLQRLNVKISQAAS